MLKIWGRPNSINVQKVMWLVGELGLEHQRINVGGAFGGLDSEAYGAMNPNRRIPVLEDGTTVVWESQACVRYLAAQYSQGQFWPETPAERSIADRWMDWKVTTLLPHLHVCFWGMIRTPEAERDMDAISRSAKQAGEVWQIFDRFLKGRAFVLGERLTMGDIPLGCAFYRYSNLQIERPSLPEIERWYDSLKSRLAFQEHVMIPVT